MTIRVAVADDLEDLLAVEVWSVWTGAFFQMVREPASGDEGVATEGAGECCAAVKAASPML